MARYLLYYWTEAANIPTIKEFPMKKALSIIVSALVAVSFAGVVLAAEATEMPAGHPPVAEKKVVKKAKKIKKAKKAVKTEEVKPVEAPAAPAAK
jgi:hypothetical protein